MKAEAHWCEQGLALSYYAIIPIFTISSGAGAAIKSKAQQRHETKKRVKKRIDSLLNLKTSSLPANPLRGLLSVAASLPAGSIPAAAVIYLHGFPALSVHPLYPRFAAYKTFPRRLCDAILDSIDNVAFICFNQHGIPGSDKKITFSEKTIRREVADSLDIIRYVRQNILKSDPSRAIHVVGLSTGAIVASLLRGPLASFDPNVSVTAVAGLLDLKKGLSYDFDSDQLAEFDEMGSCGKIFWFPESYIQCCREASAELGSAEAAKAAAETAAKMGKAAMATMSVEDEGQREKWHKVSLHLDAKYRQDFDGPNPTDIRSSIAPADSSLKLPSFLVVHGDADMSVPLANGMELYEAATEGCGKELLVIKKGTHLLSSSRHMKKFASALVTRIRALIPMQ